MSDVSTSAAWVLPPGVRLANLPPFPTPMPTNCGPSSGWLDWLPVPLDRAKAERVLRDVVPGPSGCWLWTGNLNQGYARVRYEGRLQMVHRLSQEAWEGPLPEPRQDSDHLCRMKHCENPAHTEQTSHGENLRRGDTFAARNLARTECPRGHPYTEENTYREPKRPHLRACRACHRDWRHRKKRLAAAQAAAEGSG